MWFSATKKIQLNYLAELKSLFQRNLSQTVIFKSRYTKIESHRDRQ